MLESRYPGLVIAVLLGASSASAGWSPIGPPTDRVNVLRFDPMNAQTAYAGTSCGLFKSTDGAQTWFGSNSGAPYAYVRTLAIDPSDSQRLWMSLSYGSTGLGIYRSDDGGATWSFASGGIGALEVNGFAIHPFHPDTVLASTQSSGIYRTVDGGASWSPAGLAGAPVGGVAFHPSAAETVYAGVKNDAPWRSTDGGQSWDRAGNGYPTEGFRFFLDVVPLPGHGRWVYTCGPEAHRSTDASTSWFAITTGIAPSHYLRALAAAWPATAPAAIVFLADLDGAIYRSLDGGDNFTNVAPVPPPIGAAPEFQAVAMAPGESPRVLVGGVGGDVYRSEDRGEHWQPATQGMLQGFAYAVAARGDTLLTGMLRGIWVSYDRGATWNPTDLIADYGARTWRIAVDQRGHRAFAATTDYTGAGHIYRSAGDSRHWVEIHTMGGAGYAIAVDPEHPDTLYAGSGSNILPGRIAVSHDGGLEWSEFELGAGDVAVTRVPPGGDGLAYAGATDGLFRTTDAGATWSRSGLAGLFVADLVPLPGERQILFAATRFQGVWRSDDGGLNWRSWSEGLTDLDVNALDIAPDFPGVIYAGATSRGIFVRAVDSSGDWRPYEEQSQPPVREILDLEHLGGTEPALVAATYGLSLWMAPALRTPVDVQDFGAASSGGHVLLTWSLSSAAQCVVRGVSVLRSPESPGPYIERTERPLDPQARMSFEDTGVEPGHAVWYRLRLWDARGLSQDTQPVRVSVTAGAPLRTGLAPPLEGSVGGPILLRYSIGIPAHLRLAIYDVTGSEIRLLESGWVQPGEYVHAWDRRSAVGTRVARGVYFVRLEAGGATYSRKVPLLHP